jgi:putative phosphoesterase
MKLGIVADIHANFENLKRAYALLRKLGAHAIVCAGDLADGESEGGAVVDFMQAQGTPCVQGNHDYASSKATTAHWLERWEMRDLGALPDNFRGDILKDEQRALLRDLPVMRRFELEGKRVLLTHASTWNQTSYLYPNGRQEHFWRVAEEADADVVILGHTHVPMAVEVGDMWVVNPGAVKGNRLEPYVPTCALFELGTGTTPRYRVYDIDTGQPTGYTFVKLGDLGSDMHQSHGN